MANQYSDKDFRDQFNKSLVGKKFGKLTVLNRAGSNKWHHSLWNCRCSCGRLVIASGSTLRSGHRKSCSVSCFKTINLTANDSENGL